MKPAVVHRGYQYRKYRANKNEVITWLCVREKSSKCHGRIRTRGNEVIMVTDHVCNIDEMTYKRLKGTKKRIQKRTDAAVRDQAIIPTSVPNGFLVVRSGFPSVNVISKTKEPNVESDNDLPEDCDGEYPTGKDVDTSKLNGYVAKNNNVAFT